VEGSQAVSAREIIVEQTLPPQIPGVEDPCTIIELALDDPRAFFDTISLTVVISRRADRSDQVGLHRSARVSGLANQSESGQLRPGSRPQLANLMESGIRPPVDVVVAQSSIG
jgi:hypothetical protein